jgi:hypothetical protein
MVWYEVYNSIGTFLKKNYWYWYGELFHVYNSIGTFLKEKLEHTMLGFA